MKLKLIGFLLVLAVAAVLRLETAAQVKPVYDRGAMGLEQMLKRLNTSASVMMIGAHPDDEDTALLAYLARGEHARTAYLSLTRGDGGQNIIGGELGESLGVIRTEELLQARRLDGAEQYFTRAYDYGFSKTLDEAKDKWSEEIILCDVVRAIREFRPLVVISRFSGTPADGHGQHQYAGYISPLAVAAAADIGKCTSAGPTWKVRKFYRSQGFRSTDEPRLKINTGKFDTTLGRSYFEIAMEARSQHKSQEQGVLELKGQMFSGLNLTESTASEKTIFDGLDVSVSGIGINTSNSEKRFNDLAKQVSDKAAEAYAAYDPRSPEKLLNILSAGYKLAYDAEWSTRLPGSKAYMQQKQEEFSQAIKLAAGIQIDALADTETAVPGNEFGLNIRVFCPPTDAVNIGAITVDHPTGWKIASVENIAAGQPGYFRNETADASRTFAITVAAGEAVTEPYWLRNARTDALYKWNDKPSETSPFAAPSAFADVEINVAGIPIHFRQPVEYRFADGVRGEIRRDLNIVPRINAAADETMKIVKHSNVEQKIKVNISVTNNAAEPVSGTLNLQLPAGWSAEPNSAEYKIEKKGGIQVLTYDVLVPANAADGTFTAAITENNKILSSIETIEYPHIQTHRIYTPAEIKFVVLDVVSSDRKIAYIPGSGDKTAEAAEKIGFAVDVLDTKALADGDLEKYDTIVLGIRASETVPDFQNVNTKLMDWVRSGGTLVVQYQRPSYAQQKFAPFPISMGPRVTDENAKVTILKPEHPILNTPNKITDKDLDGWVQERNLYNFADLNENYIGLLESHDAGEPENSGGLVTTNVGKGKYVYCSYSLFRQLPAGVPGAYRLLANLLSY